MFFKKLIGKLEKSLRKGIYELVFSSTLKIFTAMYTPPVLSDLDLMMERYKREGKL